MRVKSIRRAGVAVLAAAALLYVSAAFSYPPEITASYPLRGATPPNPRGIHPYGGSVFIVSHTGPGFNYLYEFTFQGSFISSMRLPGANVIAETDRLPGAYPRSYFSAVDTGTHDVKIYTTAASLVGTFMAAPTDAIAIGVGGHVVDYVYLATAGGLVRRYSPQGSFLSSFSTGVAVADLAASGGYETRWGYFVQTAPRNVAGPIYSFWSMYSAGSLAGTFSLPGSRSYGAVVMQPSAYACIRRVSTEFWIFYVYLGQGMAVAPASLGRVKALFR